MAIKDLFNAPGSKSYYTASWLNTIEASLPTLLKISNIEVIRVDDIAHVHHKHNLHSFIREEITEDRKYWYPIMRCNGMTSPYEFDGGYTYIVYPRFDVIDDLHAQHLASMA